MFTVIFVIIGTLIGAGFASGSEINLFFNRFGISGILGILISTSILFLVMYRILYLNSKYQANSYNEFINKKYKSKYIKLFLNSIINIFTLISFYVMIAGFSSYFSQELHTLKIVGSMFICIICYFIFNHSIDAIIKVNSILTPTLIILLIFLGFKSIDMSYVILTNYSSEGFVTSSILYASYNIIILIPMLISLNKSINKSIFKISFFASIIILILAIMIFLMLFLIDNFNNIELPIVFIAGKLNPCYKYIYGIVILIAIFTSSIASGYSFLDNFDKKYFKLLNFLLCISGIFIGNISFSSLINLLYPIFGFLGIFSLGFLVI